MEVIMGYFEWSYHEVDEYGIKISAYAHKGYSYLINKNKWESSKIYDCKIYNTLKEFSKHFLK
ncbi:MAG: hypothetical protein ACP5MW_07020 [Thermoplasmata archaeon]